MMLVKISLYCILNKNFATGVEEELIEDIVMELIDHKVINRPTPKGNSYFIRKKILQ